MTDVFADGVSHVALTILVLFIVAVALFVIQILVCRIVDLVIS